MKELFQEVVRLMRSLRENANGVTRAHWAEEKNEVMEERWSIAVVDC